MSIINWDVGSRGKGVREGRDLGTSRNIQLACCKDFVFDMFALQYLMLVRELRAGWNHIVSGSKAGRWAGNGVILVYR